MRSTVYLVEVCLRSVETFSWPTCVSVSFIFLPVFCPQNLLCSILFIFVKMVHFFYIESGTTIKKKQCNHLSLAWCKWESGGECERERINRRMYPVDITDLQTLRDSFESLIWHLFLGRTVMSAKSQQIQLFSLFCAFYIWLSEHWAFLALP